MCVASMIGDHYRDKWQQRDWYPRVAEWPTAPTKPITFVSQEEHEKLKAEVAELKKLLERAIKYDEDNNEPHCENEEKMVILRKIANALGVELPV